MSNKDNKDPKILECEFCGVQETKENKILSTSDNAICRSCAETALYIMDINEVSESIFESLMEETVESEQENIEESPSSYKDTLDRFVIGQDEAKKVLSVAVYNHLKRINNPEVKIDKSNTLLIGPTGSGKTFLAETISKNLGIPLAIVNTTSLTAAGYIGEDVSSVIERLWKDAGEDVQKAERGIIFLDEIDKNATAGGGTNNKDVSGKAVQQELLKILEGDIVKIYPEGNKNNRKSGEAIEINTKDILFIAGGAFVGLKDSPGVTIDALGHTNKTIKEVPDTEELIKYGMIPEFIGRFPMIVELDEISKKDMVHIMTEPEDNIISQYKNLFDLSSVSLSFDDKAINKIAELALEKKTGARGLRNVLENIMMPYMFDIDVYKHSEITITFTYNKFKELLNKNHTAKVA
jgi:ATP-dependent Clp protease ATP-binding subunit ClpX